DALPVVDGHHQVVGVLAPVEGIEAEEVEIHDLDLGVLLRQPAAETRRAHEADPGMAGPQRYLHHGQHLRPSGFPVQAAERRHDGAGAAAAGEWNGKTVVKRRRITLSDSVPHYQSYYSPFSEQNQPDRSHPTHRS